MQAFHSEMLISMVAIYINLRLIQFVTVGVVLFQCISGNTLQTHQNDGDDQLIFAHTCCRHGDRNIYQLFPNDPWKSERFWPGGYYQLTEVKSNEMCF